MVRDFREGGAGKYIAVSVSRSPLRHYPGKFTFCTGEEYCPPDFPAAGLAFS
jgi:hypothetical protein